MGFGVSDSVCLGLKAGQFDCIRAGMAAALAHVLGQTAESS